ncbi:MAG: thioredoxin domain-containing protein [Elainellaceae cyanobacterium]
MAVNGFPNLEDNKTNLVAIALVVLFAIAAVVLTRPDASETVSSVSGLMALKTTAQEAMSYNSAMENHKPTLIEFYADWCTTCQAMAPTLQAVHQQMGDQVNIVMLDIDDPQWRQQVQQFDVSGVPHMTLLQADHTVAETLVGRVPRQVLLNRVTTLL